MSYLLIFDIKREKPSLRVKVNRMLKNIKARFLQDSVWEFDDLKELEKIAKEIRLEGGKALIFKKVKVSG
jgi:CRISPR/Cas system-associated endoribonuclease Cas2